MTNDGTSRADEDTPDNECRCKKNHDESSIVLKAK